MNQLCIADIRHYRSVRFSIIIIIIYFYVFMSWYFNPRVLKLAKVKMHVQNGYDGDSETVNVLARHTALKL